MERSPAGTSQFPIRAVLDPGTVSSFQLVINKPVVCFTELKKNVFQMNIIQYSFFKIQNFSINFRLYARVINQINQIIK